MPERWLPVVGYEGVYAVSDAGRIRRSCGGRGAVSGRVLTAKKKRTGYRNVDLSRGDVKRRFLIHQLVVAAFLPPKPSLDHVINHRDGDKTNNALSNLEWCTRAENSRHARSLGLYRPCRGFDNGRAKLTRSQVRQIRALKGKFGSRKLAAMFGVSRSAIQFIHQGKHWSEWPDDLRIREFPA